EAEIRFSLQRILEPGKARLHRLREIQMSHLGVKIIEWDFRTSCQGSLRAKGSGEEIHPTARQTKVQILEIQSAGQIRHLHLFGLKRGKSQLYLGYELGQNGIFSKWIKETIVVRFFTGAFL